MLPPTTQELAKRLERIVEANHDEAITIPEERYSAPIVELEIGSLDLVEWAFELEEDFGLEVDDSTLAKFITFSLDDARQWLVDQLVVEV